MEDQDQEMKEMKEEMEIKEEMNMKEMKMKEG
jgi:hypothetical protein